MPRGANPKVYERQLVRQVTELYESGRSQAEIAGDVGLTQKVVWNLMRRHHIRARVAAKRDQRGAKNHMWKGAAATYAAMHHRLTNLYGQPKHCHRCLTSDPSKTYDWANLTGDYNEITDYLRMCRSCHRRYDNARKEVQPQ